MERAMADARAGRDDYAQRVRALRKRLALDFQPLRDALSRGLDVLVDPEAAVLCTATVEALCDALFHVVVKNLHDDAAASLAPLDTKVTVYHLHVALRSHEDLAQLLVGVDSAAEVLECFLDDASSRALYERRRLTTREAKHLRPLAASASADALPAMDDYDDHQQQQYQQEELALHARTRSEWQKREDDPFSDVDFATVLKCVHPACTLTHGATLLLSALVRELLNAVCDHCALERVARRLPPELFVEDVAAPLARVFHVGELGRGIDRSARDTLERFRLRSRQGGAVALRCRVFVSGAAARTSAVVHALPPVSRDAPLGPMVAQMCKACRVDAATHVAVYRGHAVDAAATARALGMPAAGAVVFLVRASWWDHTRRNDARRGLLLGAARRCGGAGGGGGSGAERSPLAAESLARAPKAEGKSKRAGNVHAASASRLLGVGGREEGRRRRIEGGGGGGRRGRSDGEDEDSSAADEDDEEVAEAQQAHDDEHEDSLGRLLRQRQRDNNNNNRHNHHSHAPPPPAAAGPPRRELLASMATQSAQLMDTLDEAWLGFAGISASVRSMQQTLQRRTAEEPAEGRGGGGGGGGSDGDAALETELRVRLEKTAELARQTRAAHELVAQLLAGAGRLQSHAHAPPPR